MNGGLHRALMAGLKAGRARQTQGKRPAVAAANE
jgi:hypothetical protein